MQLTKPEINCSICHRSVALDNSKADEFGQAIHEECYVLKVASGPNPHAVHSSDGKTD